MNIEEFESEVEKIIAENSKKKVYFANLYSKAHKNGNDILADTYWNEVECIEAQNKGVFQVAELVRNMLNKK